LDTEVILGDTTECGFLYYWARGGGGGPRWRKIVSQNHGATVPQRRRHRFLCNIEKCKKNELVVAEADGATGDQFEVGR
jgi:hypothetical protein